jgi:hypothetical protein
MSLYTLEIPPDQQGYQVTRGNTVVATTLDGGGPRMRKDQLAAAHIVQVQWTVGPNGYRYLNAFYRLATQEGSLPFEINLIIDHPELETYKAYFVPNTFSMQELRAMVYVFAAQLICLPITPLDAQDELDLGLFEEPLI